MAAETAATSAMRPGGPLLERRYARAQAAVAGIARQAGRRGNRAIDTEFREWTFRNRPAGTPHASRQ
ncbi:hypothetical protein [Streptomyces sp. NPDC059743]|uniref:hypothetical protein n=1 Tax=Streptomyces sp. NPDC059743 TaxID=3346928 RepID=UPI0036697DEE